MNIFLNKRGYSSSEVNATLEFWQKKNDFITIETIGRSIIGTDIKSIKLGIGPRKVMYFASIHANEVITTSILMKFIEDYIKSHINKNTILNYSIVELYKNVSIYVVPMVNPDGCDLITKNLDTNYFNIARKISSSFPHLKFPNDWKANINGVDLNLQFPACWDKAKKIKYNLGYTNFAPRDFVGISPLSEPESIALYNFSLKHNFDLTLCYHTQGEEIYYTFNNIIPDNSFKLGTDFAKSSGYLLTNPPHNSSFAGYKDWFIQVFNKPSFTIEAGFGTSPLPFSDFYDIYYKNLEILLRAAKGK